MLSVTYRVPDMYAKATRYIHYISNIYTYRVADMYSMYAENRTHIS